MKLLLNHPKHLLLNIHSHWMSGSILVLHCPIVDTTRARKMIHKSPCLSLDNLSLLYCHTLGKSVSLLNTLVVARWELSLTVTEPGRVNLL